MALSLVILGISGCGEGRPIDPAASAEPAPGLVEIPRPDLDRLEPAVQAHLREGETALEAVISEQAGPAVLAKVYGELGQRYHAYRLALAAEACYGNARFLQPEDYRWPYLQGYLHQQEGSVARSIESFIRVLELRPGYLPALLHLADLRLEQDELQPAEELALAALQQEPELAAARFVLGRAAAAKGEAGTAVRYFEAILKSHPEASVVHYPLGLAYRELGEMQKAQLFLQGRGGSEVSFPDPLVDEVEQLATGMRIHLNRGNAAFLRGAFEEARQELELAVRSAPDSGLARANLASCLVRLGRHEEAYREFEEALRLEPDRADSHRNFGTLLASLGRNERAIVHFQESLELDPAVASGHFNLANALRREGRFAEAREHYLEAIEIDPGLEASHLALLLTLIRLEAWSEAGEAAQEAHAAFPEGSQVTEVLTRLYAASPDDAFRDATRAMPMATSLWEAERTLDHLETLAMALAESGRFDEALAHQQAAVDTARDKGRPDLGPRLTANLELYRAQRPCRAPWPPHDPVLEPGRRD